MTLDALAEHYLYLKQQHAPLEAELRSTREQLLQRTDPNSKVPLGNGLLVMHTVAISKRLDSAQFRKPRPEVYAAFVKEVTTTYLTIK
jgi:hypothetical protein